MRTLSTDPVVLYDVSDDDNAPFVIGGMIGGLIGAAIKGVVKSEDTNAIKTYFESE